MNDCIKKQLDFEQEGTNAMINNVYGKEGASAESVQGAGTLSDINSGPKDPSDGGAESTAPVGSYEPTLQNNTQGGNPLDSGQRNAVADAVNYAGGGESGSSSTKPGFEAWLNKGASDNKVYFGIDKNKKPSYTGITKQTKEARLYQHNRNGKDFLDLEIQYGNLTRNQARAIEQYFIENGPNTKMILTV